MIIAFSLDIVISAAQELHSDAINKACIILDNAVIQEIEQESPHAADAYANVIHAHIISSLQHLRVSLFTIEMLMTLYNDQTSDSVAQ